MSSRGGSSIARSSSLWKSVGLSQRYPSSVMSGPRSWYEVDGSGGLGDDGSVSSCGMCDLIFEGLDLVMTFDVCGHSMHDRCSDQWLARNNRHCPVCRNTQSSINNNKPITSSSPVIYPVPSPSPVSSAFTETPFSSMDLPAALAPNQLLAALR